MRDGYWSHVTFNDDAMINIMNLLTDITEEKYPYDFVTEERRVKAASAIKQGLDLILRTQIKQNGELAAWCAQYDPDTLEPAWARTYEPPSISGQESVRIIQYLQRIENPGPEVQAAIEGALEWFKRSVVNGLRYEDFKDADGNTDRRVVPDANARPIWARFYDIETNAPIFTGRDSVIRDNHAEIEQERRVGYRYYTYRPDDLNLF